MPPPRALKTALWIAGLSVAVLGLATVALYGSWALLMPSSLSSPVDRFVRQIRGEPGATQNVNDAADALIAGASVAQLEHLADELVLEYRPIRQHFDRTFGGWVLPIGRLPTAYWTLGGTWRGPPELVLRDTDWAIILSWGHMRHAVIVYAAPLAEPPKGFHVRKVSDRVFVIAHES